jgi:hypothetical protein
LIFFKTGAGMLSASLFACLAPNRIALYDRAARLVGRFPDRRGARDLSTRHDSYLDEAYE